MRLEIRLEMNRQGKCSFCVYARFREKNSFLSQSGYMRHSERTKPICSQMMETFSVQHGDIDHAIKEALVLFTKHPPFLGLAVASQNYNKFESNWLAHRWVFCFF